MLLAFIAYATISPIQARPTLLASANVERLGAFAVLGALFCLAYPRHMILVALIVLGSAVLLELAQLLTPDRHGRIQDAIVKMTGGAFGVAARANNALFSPSEPPVPELTRSADIQLNERVSLRRKAKAIALSAPDIAPIRTQHGEAVGDYTPPGGFVFLMR